MLEADWSPESEMSARERMQPREARRCALERPMPDAAPVIAITLLASVDIVGVGA